jgi:hypothetical protein
MPDGPSAEEVILVGLYRRFAQLAVQAKEIELEAAAIKERFRKLGQGAHDIPGIGTVTVQPQRRFDPKLADKVLRSIHPDLVSKCSVSHVDSKLAKQYVSGEVYAQCQVPAGDDKVLFP